MGTILLVYALNRLNSHRVGRRPYLALFDVSSVDLGRPDGSHHETLSISREDADVITEIRSTDVGTGEVQDEDERYGQRHGASVELTTERVKHNDGRLDRRTCCRMCHE